jgi:hypothetical protein
MPATHDRHPSSAGFGIQTFANNTVSRATIFKMANIAADQGPTRLWLDLRPASAMLAVPETRTADPLAR